MLCWTNSPAHKLCPITFSVSRAAEVYSQGICPGALLAGHHQICFCSSLPSSPVVSPFDKTDLLLCAALTEQKTRQHQHVPFQCYYKITWLIQVREKSQVLRVDVVLKWKDHRILWCLESTFINGFNHILPHTHTRHILSFKETCIETESRCKSYNKQKNIMVNTKLKLKHKYKSKKIRKLHKSPKITVYENLFSL